MDCRTPSAEAVNAGNLGAERCAGADACQSPGAPGGKILALGWSFARTVQHFFPRLNDWLDALPDTRFDPMICYDKKFLFWWGLLLFCCKLSSRRQLDFMLRDPELSVLDNVNRLARTRQDTLPVNKTLAHFLEHVGSAALAQLRTRIIRRLIRMRALDACRLLGRLVIAVDGSGFLRFHRPHCARCLTQKHDHGTLFLHPVLEAKLVHTCGLALSVGTEFIENPFEKQAPPPKATLNDYQAIKQDCELKGFARLASQLKLSFPQTPLCISGDSLLACGPVLRICEQNQWAYVLTFKQGRTPALWQEFQALLTLAPANRHQIELPDGVRREYRWVNDIDYIDDEGHAHRLSAIQCIETRRRQTTPFAWITSWRVTSENVAEIAEQGGRNRWKIENQGFNTQKNSGLNLTHAYSTGPDTLKAFYYLLQIGHIFMQMLEYGRLLTQLAKQYGRQSARQLFGSLANIARTLLDSLRHCHLPDEAFDPQTAGRFYIGLNTS